jgi:Ankyrin repeats (many copies)
LPFFLQIAAVMVVDCLKALSLSALSKHLFNGAFNYDAAWTKAILSRCKACDDTEIVCQMVSLKLLAASLAQQSNEASMSFMVENLRVFLQMYPPDDQSDHEHFLIDAVALNRYDIVSLLLSSGWDVNYITRGEQLTALKVAARDSRSDIVHLLLKHGANTLPKCDQTQVCNCI